MGMTIPEMFDSQVGMSQAATSRDVVLNTSDPGTGKTRGTLEGFLLRRAAGLANRALVVAPLSILRASWGDDIEKFLENCSYAVAHGSPAKRQKAFESGARVVLINHDGVKWLAKNMDLLEDFTDLVIDEFTAFKHRTSLRSKAMLKVAQHFEHRTALSGSPTPNTILDMWHPALILDGGKRLGSRFFKFRAQVCQPEQVGPSPEHLKWADKPGAAEAVADALSDITIRYRLEDCHDIPKNTRRYMYVGMPTKVMRAYREMEQEAEIATKKGTVTAINAGVKVKKMLQILSGSVYDREGKPHLVHNDRYALVLQLVQERPHSIVAFNWEHEREQLCSMADSIGIAYAVIDGKVPMKVRTEIVRDFQKGKYQTLFCHPQSTAHGFTMTRGTATIWCTPTYNLEHFEQFNKRIYRAGQTQATETICIAARDTKEEEVYERLSEKDVRMTDLLDIFSNQTKEAA